MIELRPHWSHSAWTRFGVSILYFFLTQGPFGFSQLLTEREETVLPKTLVPLSRVSFSDSSHALTGQFSRSVMSDPLRPHRLQHARLACPSPTPRAYSNSCPLSRWCHLTISSSVIPFSSCLRSFSALGSFPMSQGAKVLQLQHQSFQWIFETDLLYNWLVWSYSPRDSRVFSNVTVQKHQFFSAQLS